MGYRRNYKSQHHLSIGDLEDMLDELDDVKKEYQNAVSRIAERIAEEMLKEVTSSKYVSKYSGNPYTGTRKEVTAEGNTASAKIINDEPEALFYEMGTGVVGADHPAVNEYIQRFGWVYDHHGHGGDGWWYPTTPDDPNPYKWTDPDGQLRAWTQGLSAMNGFYNAFKLIEQNIESITREELRK